jgi:hypothetical protein
MFSFHSPSREAQPLRLAEQEAGQYSTRIVKFHDRTCFLYQVKTAKYELTRLMCLFQVVLYALVAVATAGPGILHGGFAAPAVAAYAAPAAVAAPGLTAYSAPAVASLAAPAVTAYSAPAAIAAPAVTAYAAPVATAITKTVQYASTPVVTGYTSQVGSWAYPVEHSLVSK